MATNTRIKLSTLNSVLECDNAFYMYCTQLLKASKDHILILTSMTPRTCDVLNKFTITELRRLLIIQCGSIDAMGRQLLSLDKLPVTPKQVVLNLCPFVNLKMSLMNKRTMMKNICFVIASLINNINRLSSTCPNDENLSSKNAIVLLYKSDAVSAEDIELLKSLYFYDDYEFENTEETLRAVKEEEPR